MADDYKFFLDEEEIKQAIRDYKEKKMEPIAPDYGVTTIEFSYDRRTSEISAIVILNKKSEIKFATKALEEADWTLTEIKELEKGGRVSTNSPRLIPVNNLFARMPEEDLDDEQED